VPYYYLGGVLCDFTTPPSLPVGVQRLSFAAVNHSISGNASRVFAEHV
jgi:hypothetical protein